MKENENRLVSDVTETEGAYPAAASASYGYHTTNTDQTIIPPTTEWPNDDNDNSGEHNTEAGAGGYYDSTTVPTPLPTPPTTTEPEEGEAVTPPTPPGDSSSTTTTTGPTEGEAVTPTPPGDSSSTTTTDLMEGEATPTDFCWPTQSHTITQVFNKNTHEGIDIFPMIENKVGDKIYAIADGVVERRFEWNEGDLLEGNGSMGRCLYIKHRKLDTNADTFMRSIYMHLDQMNVTTGQTVKKGDIIGTMGHTGLCISSNGGNGTHLHFALKTKETEFLDGGYYTGTFVNPLDYEYYNHS